MGRTSKKLNARICDVINDVALAGAMKRIVIPSDAGKEAKWNFDNQFYVIDNLKYDGYLTLTQDGSRSDISKKYKIYEITKNGHQTIQFNLKPFTKNINNNFQRVVIEVDSEKKEIKVSPIFLPSF